MKFIKIFLSIIVIVAVLLIVASILLVTVVDPNRFKGQISQLVEHKTGRHMVINGKIERSIFPWIGVRVYDVTLDNAPEFAQQGKFATVGEADIRVQLLPLFSKQVEVEKLTLKNVNLNLIKNNAGKSNWEDLISSHDKQAQATKVNTSTVEDTVKSEVAAPFAIMVAGVDVSNANIHYVDEQKGQIIDIKNLMLNSKGVRLAETFPVSLAMDLNTRSNQSSNISGHFTLDANITLNTKDKIYQLDKIRFSSTLSGWKSPLQLLADRIFVDLNQQVLTVANVILASGDLNLKANLQGKNITTSPVFSGHIQAAPFNLKSLLKAFGTNITTMDPNALQHVSGSADLQGSLTSLHLNPINLVVDDSTIQGNINIEDFTAKKITFNMGVNQLNADRYLPANTKSTAQVGTMSEVTPATLVSGAVVSRPNNAEIAQKFNINGNIRIGSLTLSKTLFTNVYAQVMMNNGIVKIAPLNADVFQGNARGQVSIDLRSAVPLISLEEVLNNIQLNQLTKSNRLTGTANISANVTMRGQNMQALLSTLNGTTKFEIKNGMLVGVDVPYVLQKVWSMIKKQPAPTPPAANQTEFGVFQGTGTFINGTLKNNDLLIQSSQFKTTGNGTVNLVNQALNYHVMAVGMQAVTNEQGQVVSQMPIPLLVTGTFSKPIITPDPQAIANILLKEKLQNLQEKVRERINTEVPAAEPIREKARELLLNRVLR